MEKLYRGQPGTGKRYTVYAKANYRICRSPCRADGKDRTFFDTALSASACASHRQGTKVFIARAQVAGKPRKVAVGTFPFVTVAAARREAREALDAIRRGADPAKDKADQRRAIEYGAVTVADLADRWMTEVVRPKRKPRTIDDYERISPSTSSRPLVWCRSGPDLGTGQRLSRLDVPDTAPRELRASTLRAVLNFAETRLASDRSIAIRARASNSFASNARERFLSEVEIGAAADAIEQAEREGVIGPHAAAGLRLALFTGARSGEIVCDSMVIYRLESQAGPSARLQDQHAKNDSSRRCRDRSAEDPAAGRTIRDCRRQAR